MRRKSLVLLALALLGCARRESPAPAAQASPTKPKPFEVDTTTPLKEPLPMVAAKVNGRDIPTTQVVVAAEGALRSGVMTDKVAAYRHTLNQLVVRELLLAEALRRGLTADTAAVERAYNEARVAYKDDADWAAALKREAVTPQAFREELRAKQVVNLLLSKEAELVPEPSEAEAQEYYKQNLQQLALERVRVAHILIRVPEGASPQTKFQRRVVADEARARALAARDFGAVVKKYSEDAATSGKGGVLEPFARGETFEPLAAAAFALEPGGISEVVEAPAGFHVLKLLERLPPYTPRFEEIKERLVQHVAQLRRQERVQALVDRLRAGARIETFL
jgi:peptidyl-prolyl cis-trans isomerase C